jgi:hypothetical protein
MQIGRFGLDALAEALVEGIVSKPPFNTGRVNIVVLGREGDHVYIVRAGQLDKEVVGIAVRCPRDNVGRERASIHGESDSCHASPNASLAALMVQPREPRRKFELEPGLAGSWRCKRFNAEARFVSPREEAVPKGRIPPLGRDQRDAIDWITARRWQFGHHE